MAHWRKSQNFRIISPKRPDRLLKLSLRLIEIINKVNEQNIILQFLTSSSGTNAIGIIPGEYWGTPQDRPIIVGAHWDSVSTSPGYNDNGSGASALLVSSPSAVF
jgi:hypothetical protein